MIKFKYNNQKIYPILQKIHIQQEPKLDLVVDTAQEINRNITGQEVKVKDSQKSEKKRRNRF